MTRPCITHSEGNFSAHLFHSSEVFHFDICSCVRCSHPNGAFFDVRVGQPPEASKKRKRPSDFSKRPFIYAGNYLLSHTLPNYFTRTAVPVEEFSLLIEDMPCRATTCPTARGAGCTRMEKLEVLVAPVGVICMTPLPLLCVV
jgi:hypothetical protein